MFGFSKGEKSATMSSIINGIATTQQTMIEFRDSITSQAERVKFFNDSLETHNVSYTETLTKMRKVWSEMKKDFKATRRQVAAMANRISDLEGMGAINNPTVEGSEQLTLEILREQIKDLQKQCSNTRKAGNENHEQIGDLRRAQYDYEKASIARVNEQSRKLMLQQTYARNNALAEHQAKTEHGFPRHHPSVRQNVLPEVSIPSSFTDEDTDITSDMVEQLFDTAEGF